MLRFNPKHSHLTLQTHLPAETVRSSAENSHTLCTKVTDLTWIFHVQLKSEGTGARSRSRNDRVDVDELLSSADYSEELMES